MAVNKVIFGGDTLIDVSGDTVSENALLLGYTAHDSSGAQIMGEIPVINAVSGSISQKDEVYTFLKGYHTVNGTVGIDSTEKSKLIPGNIKSGVEILGVTGNYNGSGGTLPQTVSAGDTPVASDSGVSSEISSTSLTDTELRISVTKSGTYRFKWLTYSQMASNTRPVTSRIYKNGSAAGTLHSDTAGGLKEWSDDINCNAGDTVRLYAAAGAAISNYRVRCAFLSANIDWDNGF